MSTGRPFAQVGVAAVRRPARIVGAMTTPTEPGHRIGRAQRPAPSSPPRPESGGPAPASAPATPPRAPAGSWQPPALCIDAPGEFIAAVPAVLGFMPRRSIVVCLLQPIADQPDSLMLGAVARHDLTMPDGSHRLRLATRLAAICVQERAVAVLILVVDDRLASRSPTRPVALRRRHRELLQVLRTELSAARVAVADAWAVREIAADAAWWGLAEPDRSGRQSDPSGSPIALATVLDGRPIHASRAELESSVRVDREFAAAVAELLPRAVRDRDQAFRRALRRRDVPGYRRELLARVLAQVDRFAATDRLDPAATAEIAVALRDPIVRDAMFGLAASPRARAAELLWARMSPGLSGPDRAEAAALFGYSAYARGDGPLAGVALTAALDADPRHAMAALLSEALQYGMRPETIGTLAESGRAKAAELGVDLAVDGGPR
ncbi:DUF4192 domain-containing protein [Nocardia stercoris]|uniref:DUF4192 domain-containing protein n=1 Tax=Nocardia stercoris TaxID=2483361 RepID=UPI0011C43F59|nr:DUF4192 domain-containing protein [Nocardia stercoris]